MSTPVSKIHQWQQLAEMRMPDMPLCDGTSVAHVDSTTPAADAGGADANANCSAR